MTALRTPALLVGQWVALWLDSPGNRHLRPLDESWSEFDERVWQRLAEISAAADRVGQTVRAWRVSGDVAASVAARSLAIPVLLDRALPPNSIVLE